ncbi:MAG: hypothetical protein ACI9UR_001019 [Bacteroidia bacterium]
MHFDFAQCTPTHGGLHKVLLSKKCGAGLCAISFLRSSEKDAAAVPNAKPQAVIAV